MARGSLAGRNPFGIILPGEFRALGRSDHFLSGPLRDGQSWPPKNHSNRRAPSGVHRFPRLCFLMLRKIRTRLAIRMPYLPVAMNAQNAGISSGSSVASRCGLLKIEDGYAVSSNSRSIIDPSETPPYNRTRWLTASYQVVRSRQGNQYTKRGLA